MKKILLTTFACLAISSMVFAQEASQETTPAAETAVEEVVDAKAAAAAAKAAEKAAAEEAKKKAKEEAAAAKAAAAEAKKKAKEEAAAAKAAEKAAKAEAAKKAKEEAVAAKAAAAEAKKKAKEEAAATEEKEAVAVSGPNASVAAEGADPAVEGAETVAVNEEDGEVYVPGKMAMRIGGAVNVDMAAGDFSDYFSTLIGGNLLFETDFGLNAKARVGFSLHAGFGTALTKSEALASCLFGRFTVGPFVRLPVAKSVLLQPELNYGAALYLPKAGDGYENLKSSYTDQIIQLAVAFRIVNPKMAKNRLEIDVAPTYTLNLEDGNTGHFIGARIGVAYSIK